MSALRSAANAVRKAVQQASISVPVNVHVAKQADQLVISGPLGTNCTCLSSLDSLGVAAVRLTPESRSIDICCSDKAFFGTIQAAPALTLHCVNSCSSNGLPAAPPPVYSSGCCVLSTRLLWHSIALRLLGCLPTTPSCCGSYGCVVLPGVDTASPALVVLQTACKTSLSL